MDTITNLAGGPPLAVERCTRCGLDMAWATSKRTGKRYPCMVVRASNGSGARRAVPWQVHRCHEPGSILNDGTPF